MDVIVSLNLRNDCNGLARTLQQSQHPAQRWWSGLGRRVVGTRDVAVSWTMMMRFAAKVDKLSKSLCENTSGDVKSGVCEVVGGGGGDCVVRGCSHGGQHHFTLEGPS